MTVAFCSFPSSVCEIRERPPAEMEGQRDLPHRFVAITAMFSTDFYVCGIAPLGPKLLVLLTFDESEMTMEAGKQVRGFDFRSLLVLF